jgi:hypothetical protein
MSQPLRDVIVLPLSQMVVPSRSTGPSAADIQSTGAQVFDVGFELDACCT